MTEKAARIITYLQEKGQPAAAALFEDEERGLFYRKAKGIARFFGTRPLMPYQGGFLYPSGRENCPACDTGNKNYCHGLCVDFAAIAGSEADTAIRTVFRDFYSRVPEVHTVGGNMWTHSHPHYERVIGEGFASYRERVERIADRDMREGLLLILDALAVYAGRCADYVASCGADEKLVAALKRVPMHPARDLYEAIVGWNFVMYLDCVDNVGCLARGLRPYYRGENAVPWLAEMFENVDVNDGYSMALGPDYDNPLLAQCLEASAGRRRPMIELLVTPDMPDALWEQAIALARKNGGQPAFYHADVIREGLQKRFPIRPGDIEFFCGGGCTEAMIAGYSNVGSLDAGMNIPYILSGVIDSDLCGSRDFEEFYAAFLAATRRAVEEVTDAIALTQRIRAEKDPLPMRTLLIDDCIDRGVDYNAGGARYAWSVVNCAGMVNAVDALLVIRDLVFESKKYTPAEMIAYLDADDEGFLAECRRYAGSFGTDSDRANALARRMSEDIYACFDGRKTFLGYGFLPCSINFVSYADAGKNVKATPDGRRAFSPLADSLYPILNKDTAGPTAALRSVACFAQEKALGTPVCNLTVRQNFSAQVMRALIAGYMAMGGVQLQLTCADKEELLAAQAHPEEHRNLIVRVGGYSEYFCRLPEDIRRAVVARTVNEL